MDLNNQLMTLANKSNQSLKYAAIIFYRNKIIGMGYNSLITNSSNSRYCLLRGLQT